MPDQDKKTKSEKDNSSKKDEKVEIDKKDDQNSQGAVKGREEQVEGEGGKAATKTVVVKGRKKKKKEPFLRGGRGQVHIKSSYNNTMVTVSDLNGAVLVWSTAGKQGFKGAKKSTPYAAGAIVKSLADKIKSFGIKEVDIFVKGVGTGREAAVRAFGTTGIQVVSIKDVTPAPHGGCRPKKPRRI